MFHLFGKNGTEIFFPTLIVRQKWHVACRDVQLGDVVLVQDKNALKNNWTLAIVVKTIVSSDGKVRNVTVRYKHNTPGATYRGQPSCTVNRSVHSLVVILPIEEQ